MHVSLFDRQPSFFNLLYINTHRTDEQRCAIRAYQYEMSERKKPIFVEEKGEGGNKV
jgi:hypothetical protein